MVKLSMIYDLFPKRQLFVNFIVFPKTRYLDITIVCHVETRKYWESAKLVMQYKKFKTEKFGNISPLSH